MAPETGLGLGLLGEQLARLSRMMDAVAGEAGNSRGLMLAPSPEHHSLVICMAGKARLRRSSRFILAWIPDELGVAALHMFGQISAVARSACDIVRAAREFHRLPMRRRP